MSKKILSRRTFLSNAGVMIGLPLLDAMMPSIAWAQAQSQYRFICTFMGTCNGGDRLTKPAAFGPLVDPMPMSFASLEPVKQHISIVSGMTFPLYNSVGGANEPPTGLGSAANKQHHGTRSPMLSGVTAQTKVQPMIRGTSADQVAADYLGSGSKLQSLHLRVQAASYNGRTGASAQTDGMSVRKQGNLLNENLPEQSPLRAYDMLFSGSNQGNPNPPPSNLLSKNKSSLDLVVNDISRLMASVHSKDKEILEAHFERIRALENSLSATINQGPTTTVQTMPARPGPDPAPTTYNFGGWAEETMRGQIMADIISHAIASDLTRVITWMLTHDQCWIGSRYTSGSNIVPPNGGATDIHSDSHFAPAEI